jgi:tRNA1Val (adenine37-N6)-methyltransferase
VHQHAQVGKYPSMPNSYFQFKQFRIEQDSCAMKVTTDACAFGAWVASLFPNSKSVLDVGAGTGLLSLMIAQSGAETIDAVEIEQSCFMQMKENMDQSVFTNQIHPLLGDFLQLDISKQYELILSNPPFHENQLKSDSRSINLARHSDAMPLNLFFQKSKSVLDPNGSLCVLIPFYRKKETLDLAAEVGLCGKQLIDLHHDANHAAFRTFIHFSQNQEELKEEHLFIYERENQYSQRFKSLIAPYYLHV